MDKTPDKRTRSDPRGYTRSGFNISFILTSFYKNKLYETIKDYDEGSVSEQVEIKVCAEGKEETIFLDINGLHRNPNEGFALYGWAKYKDLQYKFEAHFWNQEVSPRMNWIKLIPT